MGATRERQRRDAAGAAQVPQDPVFGMEPYQRRAGGVRGVLLCCGTVILLLLLLCRSHTETTVYMALYLPCVILQGGICNIYEFLAYQKPHEIDPKVCSHPYSGGDRDCSG